MRVLITGGSGLIGSALTESLLADGHSVRVLTRQATELSPASRDVTDPADHGLLFIPWDGITTYGWGEMVNDVDAIVNLAGENLAKWPWTKKQKQCIWDSRVLAGQALTQAIRSASSRPKTFIQISGINHYGLRGDPADEATPPGDDFLSRLTVAWEQATSEVEALGVRRCILRLGVVLAESGGLFPLMALPARLFMGGPIGNGKQAVPWIHLVDVVGVIRFLLDHEQTSGPYNGVSPEIITNADFYRLLTKALSRPYWLPTPAFLLRWILGGMSALVVEGRAAIPKRLLDAGFVFQISGAGEAFARLASR